ncbi:MAG: NADH:flavin oxidoreductase/NADH oxidase [Bifidobacterium sp.]|jgi:2,4-dienoyl-CoA reductase-like NADH-dependent reductase (Old Yellow Enzyme family)|nr:NADH:flavin oxidoreductase/NADH oxidase [Bifidobacterium sp.]MCH4174951.1 NADH:flavin oxidoreductase/NADH oxidase [Bifidobacterium sp.]
MAQQDDVAFDTTDDENVQSTRDTVSEELQQHAEEWDALDAASAAGKSTDPSLEHDDHSASSQTKGNNKVKKQRNKSRKGSKNINTVEAPDLFSPLTLRGVTTRNRIWMPPMDTYSAFGQDGRPTQFHYQHYVSRALGGFGMVIAESTAVSAEGRISPCDLGLWEDGQIDAWRWIVDDVKKAGAVAAVQLNHAGRKASTGCFSTGHINATVPQDEGGWPTVAPSAIPYGHYDVPRELSIDEIHGIVDQFKYAAGRAVNVGFEAIELHAAHGYLISQFLDPLSNQRTDEYGGPLENRMRFLIDIVDAVRSVIPEEMPLLVRISATDWAAGGWDLDQSIETAKVMKAHGVDLVDVSTGGIISGVTIPAQPNYQVPFAQEVRQKALIPTTAVGLITKAKQAARIVHKEQADAVEIGRAALRDPYWPLRAGYKLGLRKTEIPYPEQYIRGAYGTKR